MKCPNCNCTISDDSQFCIICGKPVTAYVVGNSETGNGMIQNGDVNLNQYQYQNPNPNQNQNPRPTFTKLSIISLVCEVVRYITIGLMFVVPELMIISLIPLTSASIALAIISRVKYNDKMSKILLIYYCVIFALGVIASVIFGAWIINEMRRMLWELIVG